MLIDNIIALCYICQCVGVFIIGIAVARLPVEFIDVLDDVLSDLSAVDASGVLFEIAID